MTPNKLLVPTPSPLYKLKHPALRQFGCPICQTPNVNFKFGDTVVKDGPLNHDVLGPIVGNVFSVIGECDKGHIFLLRIVNHRDSALMWTDVLKDGTATPSSQPVLDQSKLAFNTPTSSKENLIQEQEPPAPMPIKITQMSDAEGKTMTYEEMAQMRCYADQPVFQAIQALDQDGVTNAVCLQCPNLACPVSQMLLRHIAYKRNNVDACYNPPAKPLPPHDKFLKHAHEALKSFVSEITNPQMLTPASAELLRRDYNLFMSATPYSHSSPDAQPAAPAVFDVPEAPKAKKASKSKKADEKVPSEMLDKLYDLANARKIKLPAAVAASYVADIRRYIGQEAAKKHSSSPFAPFSEHVGYTFRRLLNQVPSITPSQAAKLVKLMLNDYPNMTPESMGVEPAPPVATPVDKPKSKPKPKHDPKAVVPGCPDKLTYGMASKAVCQEHYCALCPITSCTMHPKAEQ